MAATGRHGPMAAPSAARQGASLSPLRACNETPSRPYLWETVGASVPLGVSPSRAPSPVDAAVEAAVTGMATRQGWPTFPYTSYAARPMHCPCRGDPPRDHICTPTSGFLKQDALHTPRAGIVRDDNSWRKYASRLLFSLPSARMAPVTPSRHHTVSFSFIVAADLVSACTVPTYTANPPSTSLISHNC